MIYAITGAGAGLGKAIADAIRAWDLQATIHRIDRKFGHDVRSPQGLTALTVDGEVILESVVPVPELSHLDVLINCAAVNNIAWFKDLSEELWDETLDINAKGIFRMTKHYLGALTRRGGTVLNIVSNASHMPMRCSLAYNASKGAAHIMTLQMARELYSTHDITVFGISPNKLSGTEMSDDIDRQVVATRGWSMAEAQAYQLQGLATKQETDPAVLAEFIAFLLSSKERHRYLHGCILPYGA